MLGVRNQTSTLGILADTGRYPLVVRQHIAATKYLSRLQSNSCPDILRYFFVIQKELYEKGFACWYSRVVSLLEDLNLSISENINFSQVKLAVYSNAQHKLFTEINDSDRNPKLRTYKYFKRDLRLEPYLSLNIHKSLYCHIARFRLSSHNLRIELGRHKRPFIPAEERLCEKCRVVEVEDEYHCLMVCPHWNNIRLPLMEQAVKCIAGFLVLSSREQFLAIMENKSIELNLALASFLKVALSITD